MSQTNTLTPSPKTTAMAVATTTPTLNKNLVITNNSSIALDIIDALATDDSQVVFEQSLKLLPTTTGATSIAASGSGTVVLDDSHMNSGVATYTKLYDIIYAKSDTLFPVASIGAMLDHTTQAYAPVTITADEVTIMKQAEAFTQTIAAYPTSQLAKDYAAALQSTTDDASSDDDIDDKVTAFFTSTQQYKLVTLDALIALKSYYNTFPMVWANYQASKTFYFYSSDGTTTTYGGSLAIGTPATVKPDKTLPGFTFTFTDASNATKPLYFSNGQFVDDVNSDVPAICLTGTFVLKSVLTKVDTDTMTIPILSGTINSKTVLGYDTQLTKDSDGNWSGLYTLLHPKDAQGWITLFMTFIGVVMGIDFLGKGLKSLKDKLTGEEAETGSKPSPSDVEAARSSVKANEGLSDPRYQKLMDKINAQEEATKSLQDQMTDADARYQDRLTEDWRTAMDGKMDAMSDMLEQMLDSGHATTEMNDADDDLSDAYDSVDNPSTADLSNQISQLNDTIEGLRTTINQQYEAIINKLKTDAQTELNEAKQESDDAHETADSVNDDVTDGREGSIPDDTDTGATGFEGE